MSQPTIPDDVTLLTALKLGDTTAFEVLYNRYWSMLFNTAFKYVKDKEACKELVHDVLLDLWQRRESLDIRVLEAYLKTAIRFRTINYISRSKTPAFFELFDSISTSPDMAENRILEKDMLDLIKAWIAVLPAKRREIFVKHFFQQLTTQEIAGTMNISQKTVQNQIGIALQFLKTRLGQLFSLFLSLFVLLSLFAALSW